MAPIGPSTPRLFGHEMGSCAKNYKNLPSSLFLGINGLNYLNIFAGSCRDVSTQEKEEHEQTGL